MSTLELKKRLIDKIQKIENEILLEEASRLLGLETDNMKIYHLNPAQINIVNQAREQIKKGDFLTEDQANKEIDEWLNE